MKLVRLIPLCLISVLVASEAKSGEESELRLAPTPEDWQAAVASLPVEQKTILANRLPYMLSLGQHTSASVYQLRTAPAATKVIDGWSVDLASVVGYFNSTFAAHDGKTCLVVNSTTFGEWRTPTGMLTHYFKLYWIFEFHGKPLITTEAFGAGTPGVNVLFHTAKERIQEANRAFAQAFLRAAMRVHGFEKLYDAHRGSVNAS